MKRYLVTMAHVLIAMALFTDVAGAACTEIPPKEWTGTVRYSFPGPVPDVTEAYFTNNDCAWGDHQATFDRFDAAVFDVASHAGLPGSVRFRKEGTLGTNVLNLSVSFLDASCNAIPGVQWGATQPDVEYFNVFPANAKWAIVTPAVGVGFANDIAVTLKSPGRKCPKV